ncbi:MAG TPA: protein kinase [Vicinamibacterales bacterium]|nr:protein kinase [Vicinamibacterales bacterium]
MNSQALPPGTRLGVYEVTAQIGEGGMGQVYRARDTTLNRDVAIKVLLPAVANDPDRLARFRREAQVLASLNHPNIAHIHGLDRQEERDGQGGTVFIIMELVEGEELAQRIARGPIPLDEALLIARQIAEVLDAAHEQGIIHRDLKPANIKVRPDGTVKVLDFGLARAVDPADGSGANAMHSPTRSMHATEAGIILGTVAYMSPEQAVGHAVDRRSDLWAFGVVVLEMLTGRQVFSGETVAHVLASVLKSEPDWTRLPIQTPTSIRRLLRRCLEKDRKRRLDSAADARLEIDDALAGPADASTAVVSLARGLSWREQTAWGLATMLALVALTLTIGWITARRSDLPITRFSIAPPEQSAFASGGGGAWGSPVVVSPDGRRIVIVAVGPDGKKQLWIRPLDAQAPQPLAGTEGASSPFWSPDSRWIAFFANSKLKRIAAGGGEAQILCGSGAGGGGTWNGDDVILFSPAESGEAGLVRVPAGGGTPVPVTTLDAAHGETNHLWPQFLPDGRHYLYVGGGRDAPALYVGSLGSKDRIRILDAERLGYEDSKVEYAAQGYLLYVRGRALVAQPFDPTRLALAGDAIQVVDGVLKEGPGSSAFSVSATGVLVFWGGGVPPYSQLVWMRRDGTSAGTVGPAGAYLELSLAPDDRTLAISRYEPDEKVLAVGLWLVDAQRGSSTKFTFGIGSMAPTWSRDSAHVAFASPRGGPPSLYQKPSDNGGLEELLLRSPVSSRPTDWSAADKTLVYQSFDRVTRWDLWLMPTSGARTPTPFLRTPFNETSGRISPDGHWMAYVSDESGAPEVYVTSYPNARGKWSISAHGGNAPKWRRDGKELFFVAPNRQLIAVPVNVGNASAAFDAGPSKVLFDVPKLEFGATGLFSEWQYAASADGQRFLVRVPVSETRVPPATVVLNWSSEIRK